MSRATKPTLYITLLVASLGLGGLVYYVQTTPDAQRIPVEKRRVGDPKISGEVPKGRDRKSVATTAIREVVISDGEVRLRADQTELPPGENPHRYVITKIFRDLNREDVRVLGTELKDGILAIDCNAAVTGGYGSSQESALLAALKLGLGQFREIRGFSLSADGQPVEELGHFELGTITEVVRGDRIPTGSDAGEPKTP